MNKAEEIKKKLVRHIYTHIYKTKISHTHTRKKHGVYDSIFKLAQVETRQNLAEKGTRTKSSTPLNGYL